MAFVAIPNGVRVVHVGTLGGQQIINTFGAENGGGLSVGQALGEIARRHGEAWRAQILPLLAGSYSHAETLAYSLEDQTAPAGSWAPGAAAAGTGTGNSHGAQVCVVATLRTGLRGRLYTGRAFISGLAQNTVALASPVAWNASSIGNVQTRLDAYKAAVDPNDSTTGGRLAVCSKGRWHKDEQGRPLYGVGEPLVAPTVTPVTGVVVRSYLGTQRRRTRD